MRAAVSLLVLALIAACSSPEPEKPAVVRLFPPTWVADSDAGWDPAAQPGRFFATGRAPLQPDRTAAASKAEDEARQQLTARVLQAMGRLQAAWRKQHEHQLEPAQLEGLSATDREHGQVILKAAGGMRLKGQWEDDQTFFAWVELDTLAVLQPAFEADLSARLAPLSRELTPADRRAFTEVLTTFAAEIATP